jgi:NDP-sugar pyrophosphorylase family protein
MTVYENDGRFDTSNVEYADGRVLRYEKGLDPVPAGMRWIDYGLSVLERDLVAQRIPGDTVADLATLCTMLAAEGRLAGLLVPDRFYEIGSPEGLAEVTALLEQRAE